MCLLNNNGFSLSSFSLSSLSFLWIAAQFPQEKFLSYGRILTLDYYFLLMCILFTAGLKESPENEPAVAALKRQEDEGMSFPCLSGRK